MSKAFTPEQLAQSVTKDAERIEQIKAKCSEAPDTLVRFAIINGLSADEAEAAYKHLTSTGRYVNGSAAWEMPVKPQKKLAPKKESDGE